MISHYEKRLILALVFVVCIGTVLYGNQFLSYSTVNILAHQIPELGMISMGLMVCIIGSSINLSVVSTATLAGIIGGMFMNMTDDFGVFSVVGGIILMIIIGGLAGALNGFIVSYIEVPVILTTLGTLMFFRGVAMNLTKGGSVSGFQKVFIAIGNADLLYVPVPFVIFLGVVIGLYYILNYSSFGQHLYRIGKNKNAAKYSGIPVKRFVMQAYILSGTILGLAAVIMTARYNSIRVDYGATYLMTSIVAVSLGGVNIRGGKGSVLGVVIALILVSLVIRILNIADVDSDIIDSVLGLLLLGNVLVQYITDKNNETFESQIL